MSKSDYEEFVSATRAGAVPDGFTDDVMETIARREAPSWGTPVLRAAVWAAAVLVLAVRIGGTLAVFWTG